MRRESPARRLLWLLFSVTGLSARAYAEGTTPFSGPLLFRGCESGERQEIGRLVAIDWAGIEESSSSRAGSITVACREGRFDVSVTRPDGRELTRSIDLQQLLTQISISRGRRRLHVVGCTSRLPAAAGHFCEVFPVFWAAVFVAPRNTACSDSTRWLKSVPRARHREAFRFSL